MIIETEKALFMQILKKKKLDREISWINQEFRDFSTLSDLELYNTERYVSLHLRPS